MTVRFVLNQTTKSVKRHVTTQLTEIAEIAAGTIGAHTGENNANLVVYDQGAATVWFYPGYEHIPSTTTQGGTTAP